MNVYSDLAMDSKAVIDRTTCGCGATEGTILSGPAQNETKTDAAPAPVGQKRPRFLVVEDMPELADLLVHNLEALGIEAEVATTGKAAMSLLSSESFDAAVIDIELPDISGFDVAERAHASGCLRNTQIVFCTGSRSEEYFQRAARISGCRFLWKPFTMQDLMRSIGST